MHRRNGSARGSTYHLIQPLVATAPVLHELDCAPMSGGMSPSTSPAAKTIRAMIYSEPERLRGRITELGLMLQYDPGDGPIAMTPLGRCEVFTGYCSAMQQPGVVVGENDWATNLRMMQEALRRLEAVVEPRG